VYLKHFDSQMNTKVLADIRLFLTEYVGILQTKGIQVSFDPLSSSTPLGFLCEFLQSYTSVTSYLLPDFILQAKQDLMKEVLSIQLLPSTFGICLRQLADCCDWDRCDNCQELIRRLGSNQSMIRTWTQQKIAIRGDNGSVTACGDHLMVCKRFEIRNTELIDQLVFKTISSSDLLDSSQVEVCESMIEAGYEGPFCLRRLIGEKYDHYCSQCEIQKGFLFEAMFGRTAKSRRLR